MSTLSKFVKQWQFSPRFLLGVLVLSMPIAYIIKKHMDWKPNPDSKKRMLIHQLFFWASGLPALKFLHKAWGEFDPQKPLAIKKSIGKMPGGSLVKATTLLSAAAFSLIGGFEGGERLAKFLVPKVPKPHRDSADLSILPDFASPPPPLQSTNYRVAQPTPVYRPFIGI